MRNTVEAGQKVKTGTGSPPADANEAIVARRLRPENLVPILSAAYGHKHWEIRDPEYWKAAEWDFHAFNEATLQWNPETRRTYKVIQTVIEWSSDPETRGHLDPPPGVPTRKEDGSIEYTIPDRKKADEVSAAIADLAKYYYNSGEPRKVTPLIAVDKEEDLVGVLTIRWRGDPFNPPGRKKAGIERLIVDPLRRHQGIGRRLMATAIEYAFNDGYNNTGATEIRSWIMQDDPAGDWRVNFLFLRSLGFQYVPGEPHWPEYAARRDIHTKRGDATWFRLQKEWYDQKRRADPRIRPYDIIE